MLWLGIVNPSIINHRKTFDGWNWSWKWDKNWSWNWRWKWNYCFLSFANRSDKASAPTIRVTVELNLSLSIHTTVGLGCGKFNREVRLMNSNTWTKEHIEGNLSALFFVFYLRRSRGAVVVSSWNHKIGWGQFENINKAKQGQQRFASFISDQCVVVIH